MSDYICDIRCSYRQPSGYCGLTSGYETCQFRQIHQPNTAVGYIPPIKKTNADSIRAMTDEELAKLMVSSCAEFMTIEICRLHKNCFECWLEWLKKECEEC